MPNWPWKLATSKIGDGVSLLASTSSIYLKYGSRAKERSRCFLPLFRLDRARTNMTSAPSSSSRSSMAAKTQQRQHLYCPVASSPYHIWGAAISGDSISFPIDSNESGGNHKIPQQHQIRVGQQPVLPIGHGQWQINFGQHQSSNDNHNED
ncbi:hypothetical protein ACLOJK_018897 [Asimina triloba]